jgi:hypothetical protein
MLAHGRPSRPNACLPRPAQWIGPTTPLRLFHLRKFPHSLATVSQCHHTYARRTSPRRAPFPNRMSVPHCAVPFLPPRRTPSLVAPRPIPCEQTSLDDYGRATAALEKHQRGHADGHEPGPLAGARESLQWRCTLGRCPPPRRPWQRGNVVFQVFQAFQTYVSSV